MNNQLLPSHNNIENNIKNEKYTTSTLNNKIELKRSTLILTIKTKVK